MIHTQRELPPMNNERNKNVSFDGIRLAVPYGILNSRNEIIHDIFLKNHLRILI